MKQDNTKLYILGGVALLAYIGVIRPILKKLGIATGQETTNVNNAQTLPAENNPFKPEYYKIQHKRIAIPVTLKTQSGLSNLYKNFENAFGYFYDDEDAIKGVFVQLASKMQVSQFSEYVQNKNGVDIITFMKRGKGVSAGAGLNDTEINQIIEIVNKKPVYTK